MEKEIGKIKKSDNTDIILRIDDFGGRAGLTIREYVTSEKYTGFTKSGTRIPAESFENFKELVDSVSKSDFAVESMESAAEPKKLEETEKAE